MCPPCRSQLHSGKVSSLETGWDMYLLLMSVKRSQWYWHLKPGVKYISPSHPPIMKMEFYVMPKVIIQKDTVCLLSSMEKVPIPSLRDLRFEYGAFSLVRPSLRSCQELFTNMKLYNSKVWRGIAMTLLRASCFRVGVRPCLDRRGNQLFNVCQKRDSVQSRPSPTRNVSVWQKCSIHRKVAIKMALHPDTKEHDGQCRRNTRTLKWFFVTVTHKEILYDKFKGNRKEPSGNMRCNEPQQCLLLKGKTHGSSSVGSAGKLSPGEDKMFLSRLVCIVLVKCTAETTLQKMTFARTLKKLTVECF